MGKYSSWNTPNMVVTELKAAAIDVPTAMAIEPGIKGAYADNEAVQEGDSDLDSAIWKVVRSAVERFKETTARVSESD